MTLPKQRANESDADYAVRLEKSKKANKEATRKWSKANREARKERNRKYYEANREARKEYCRKWREANREARKEYYRKWREANREYDRKRREANREVKREYDRKRSEAKILAQAKGKPLQSNFNRAKRPLMLSRLIYQEAKNFCLEWGFEMERSLDHDVLRQAARNIRDSAELNGEPNPWYCTDFLHESVVTSRNWPSSLRVSLRKQGLI